MRKAQFTLFIFTLDWNNAVLIVEKGLKQNTRMLSVHQISIRLGYFHLSPNFVHQFVYFPSKYFRSLLINLIEIWHEMLSQKSISPYRIEVIYIEYIIIYIEYCITYILYIFSTSTDIAMKLR